MSPSSSVTKTIAADRVEAHAAADAWLYGAPFRFEGQVYRVARYYPLIEEASAAVVVTLEPIGAGPAA
jgi:hypothetical protein